jgi:microcystin-dependent protein
LFTILSTTYGAGNGSTTFNLPDLRGRVVVGLDNMGGTDAGRLSVANTLGGSGGSQTHTLTESEMPNHYHNIPYTTGQAVAGGPYTELINTGSPNANFASGYTGGGGAHNNMQPYMLLNSIIKT